MDFAIRLIVVVLFVLLVVLVGGIFYRFFSPSGKAAGLVWYCPC